MNLKALLLGSAAFAAIGVASESAQAQSYAFGAGATFPQIAYRELMDCLYSQAQGSPGKPGPRTINPVCVTLGGPNLSGFGGMILYAPTGSGNGKTVLRTNNKASIVLSGPVVAYTSDNVVVNGNAIDDTADYDGIQFIGTDDVYTTADMNAWNTTVLPPPVSATAQAAFGNLIQIPALAGAVGIGFVGTDGTGAALTITNPTPTNGSSGLNLSRQALCGIVSGHITKWNNTILNGLNGGVALGTGNITFIHRQDGSGTSFLLANAMATQCQFVVGPNSETDPTVVSYAFPWTERTTSCPAGSLFLPRPANLSNWPDFGTDQCGVTIPNPGGGTFNRAAGSGGVVALMSTTPGSMGYASADFWLPVTGATMRTANVQSQWDLTASTGQFQPPSWQAAEIAMSAAVPQMNSTTRPNPLTWSLQAVQPNPVLPGAYPITGFTFIATYQCFQGGFSGRNGNNAFFWFKTFLDFLYGSNASQILNANAFASAPSVWTTEIYTLFNDPVNGFNGSGCAGKPGAY
jgi:phosphate transport system substrate-binding protein